MNNNMDMAKLMSILSKMDKKDLEEGLAKGRAEGDKSAKLEIARNLLARGFSKDETAELTGLSLQELASL